VFHQKTRKQEEKERLIVKTEDKKKVWRLAATWNAEGSAMASLGTLGRPSLC
jgi:hypothetical protein